MVSHSGRNIANELHLKYDVSGGMVLGRGACGSVMSIRHRKTKELYAMKVINLSSVGSTLESLLSELEIQRTLDHPNICKIFESYVDEAAGEMAIVMEICTGAPAARPRRPYAQQAACRLACCCLLAAACCGARARVHSSPSCACVARCVALPRPGGRRLDGVPDAPA